MGSPQVGHSTNSSSFISLSSNPNDANIHNQRDERWLVSMRSPHIPQESTVAEVIPTLHIHRRSDEGMEELTIPVTQRFVTPRALGQVFQFKAVQNALKMKFVTTGQNVVEIPQMQSPDRSHTLMIVHQKCQPL
ncbi:hypothetical protein AVEN_12876-1 [Araneus ventricosus]|uniref:Uncharacterized protein n=1 Tax=Araneus ventricosus TaxID=182803 RepID=A0A4Y1ZUE7_ARAVE|nr:hypothetical protein AVEN_12876-1 [Araneus ventricosus]